MWAALAPIIGSLVGGLFSSGGNSQPQINYTQPPTPQIHPIFEGLYQNVANMLQSQLGSGPRGDILQNHGGIQSQLLPTGWMPNANSVSPMSLFGQKLPWNNLMASMWNPEAGGNTYNSGVAANPGSLNPVSGGKQPYQYSDIGSPWSGIQAYK